ncbi:MAG: serine/threonine-protein kinase [Deltaproteobacteria bacterium]|nr:serine/threonine-protein kinase [Deltaproteobacteria bacterium]
MSAAEEPFESDPRSTDATLVDVRSPGHAPTDRGPITTISRYLVIERLGSGAMGVVLRAYDPRLRREVALKLLHRREDSDAEARMLREAQSMAQLSHPNVVGIYDAETTEYGVMIAMELVVGVPLDRWLEEQSRSTSQVLAAFLQAGRGLVAAHAAGLIHRDFKPANVFMGTGDGPQGIGRVRVGDFGLARETAKPVETDPSIDAPASVELTAAGTIMGTPVYMAPEQHMGLDVDERSDQFAFCVSLWEAIHGERPFEGAMVFALAVAKQRGQLRPPRTKIPTAIQAAIERGLSADPNDRWPDLATLLERLEPRRRRWGTLAVAATIATVGVAATAMLTTDTVPPRQARCTTARQLLAETWNEQTAATLQHNVRAPPRLFQSVGAYAVELRDYYDQTCQADPPLDDLRFDVTMGCLDARTRRIATIVEGLSTGPIQQDKQIDKLIDGLTPIDRCADTQWMGTRQMLPDDPRQRQVVLELQGDIARVKHLRAQGQLAEAAALSDATVARAEASQFVPILASAVFTRSAIAKTEGRYDYAAALLRRVLELRLSIGDDEGGLAAAVDLVFVRGVMQDRFDEADGWAAVARGLIGGIDIGPVRRGWLDNHVGASMNARGEPEAAIAPLRRAAQELTTGLGPEHKSIADPLVHLARALTMLGRPAEAIEPAERAVRLRQAHYAPTSPTITTALLVLAQAQDDAGAHAEALATLRRGLALHETDGAEAIPATVAQPARLWRQIATVHERSGDAAAAADAHRRADALEPPPTD